MQDAIAQAVERAVTAAMQAMQSVQTSNAGQSGRGNDRDNTQSASPSPAEPANKAQEYPRALTADLQPATDYYLPNVRNDIPAVDPSKIKYPHTCFSDHKGEIEYDAWKMRMKLFIQQYPGNFITGKSQVEAYFVCTSGEAQTLILQHMDPALDGTFETAADVLKALDQRFFDHNRVQSAKLKYNRLRQETMTYNDFRIKFTKYASTGKISRSRWFEDVCDKIAPHLKMAILTEKYKMNDNYETLDEFLAVTDRETRNVKAEELRKPVYAFNPASSDRGRGILKKEDWRADAAPLSDTHTRYPGTSPHPHRPSSPAPTRVSASQALSAETLCFNCSKPGHFAKDCPTADAVHKKIAEMTLETDELSENF